VDRRCDASLYHDYKMRRIVRMRIAITVLTFAFVLFSIVGIASAGTIMWEDGGEGNIYWNTGRVGIGSTYTSANGLTIVETVDTAYENVAPYISNTLLSIVNMQTAESANDMSMIQFVVNGGTYNRVGAIGLVAESESNREAALVFTTDDGGNREEKMRISGNGNVGIGTTNPQSKLAVNGTIKAKEVTVTTSGWPDFVFEESYKLPSLDHVDSYIRENKHLPDVPSAKQIEEDGLSMAEMMAKQMQKIEELTLYVITQNKKIERLERELAELKEVNRSKQ